MPAATSAKKKKPAAKKTAVKKPAPKKRNGGRATTYSAAALKLAYWCARSGLIDTEIAAELGIAISTFYKWRKAHPEFAEALDAGKDIPDEKVEQALYKRAIGYEYEETKIKDTIKGEETTHSTLQMAPDTTACIFWLKNRRPERWRDKHDVEHGGNVTVVLPEGMDNA